MAQPEAPPEDFPAITVTITRRLYDWLYERRRSIGIPLSRTVRDALEVAYAEDTKDEQPKRSA